MMNDQTEGDIHIGFRYFQTEKDVINIESTNMEMNFGDDYSMEKWPVSAYYSKLHHW